MLIEPVIKKSDMIKCALCKDAPCSSVCPDVDPAGALLGIWFDDQDLAALRLPDKILCAKCDAPCEKACVNSGNVPIRHLMNELYEKVRPEAEIPIPDDEERLKCDICGVPLENPFILSSSVVASTYDMCERAFKAGWAGVCFKKNLAGFSAIYSREECLYAQPLKFTN